MKILQVTSSFLPVIGGMERVVFETSKELVKRGHEVTILTTDIYFKDQEFKPYEEIEGIKVIRFKNNLFLFGYGYSKEGYSWLKQNWKNYDLVHCHGYNRFLSEFAVSYLSRKIPVVFTPHGFIHTKKHSFFKFIHDKTLGKKIRKADLCTMLTKLDLLDYSRLGVDLKKVIELPNGVDLLNYKTVNKQKLKEFKKKFNLSGNVLLSVGRIHESKGFQYIAQAIKDLNCKLLIVGPDAGYKQELQGIIDSNNLSKKVIFSGTISDEELKLAYHACDLFVLFSEWEGFGLVVIEAMAAQKPVIVSNVGSLPYLVKNNQNGFLVDFPNSRELKKKVVTLLKDKKKSESFVHEGLKTSKKYDWKIITDKTIKIYKSLLE